MRLECMFVYAGTQSTRVVSVCLSVCMHLSHGLGYMRNAQYIGYGQGSAIHDLLVSIFVQLWGSTPWQCSSRPAGERHFQILLGQWRTCLYNCLVVY